MKFKTRLKIAHEMIVKRPFAKWVSLLLLIVALSTSGVMVFLYGLSQSYKMKAQMGFSRPMSEIYYLRDGSDRADLPPIEGVNTHEYYYGDSDYPGNEECFNFIPKLNKSGHMVTSGDFTEVFANDFDVFNITLTEGKDLREYDLKNINYRPIYLSEKYKGYVSIGEHYYWYVEIDGKEKLQDEYEIAGFFSSDSFMPCDNMFLSYPNKEGTYSLEYAFIVVYPPCKSGLFIAQDKAEYEELMNKIQADSWDTGEAWDVWNVDAKVEYDTLSDQQLIAYFGFAALLLSITAILILLVMSISDIVISGNEYGLWMINKGTQSDMCRVICWQVALKALVSLVFSTVIAMAISHSCASGDIDNEKVTEIVFRQISLKFMLPCMLAECALISVLALIIPVRKFRSLTPVQLVKGEMTDSGRISIPRFTIGFTICISMFVAMNLTDTFKKVTTPIEEGKIHPGYNYEKSVEVTFVDDPNEITEEGYNTENMEKVKGNKRDMLDAFKNRPSLKGNVVVASGCGTFNDGTFCYTNVVLSQNEELPYGIKTVSEKGNVYIGNAYDKFWDGDTIKIFHEDLPVAGVLKEKNLSKCKELFVPFDSLTESGKTDALSDIYLASHRFIISMGSESEKTVNEDLQTITDWLNETGKFVVKPLSKRDTNEVINVKSDIYIGYERINWLLTFAAFGFCLVAIAESSRLYINGKRRDIGIMWSLGMKPYMIRTSLVKDLAKPVVMGFAAAVILEVVFFAFAFNYNLAAVIKYAGLGAAVVIIVEVILLELTLRVNMKKSIAVMVRNEE